MKRKMWLKMLIVVALTVPLSGGGLLVHGAEAEQGGPHGPGLEAVTEPAAVQADLGGVVTYQGFLSRKGSPADGEYDFRFRLYNARVFGVLVGETVHSTDVTVTDGVFTVSLDFGDPDDIFDGRALWLEIGVKGSGNPILPYTVLAPRQPITAAPYAHSLRPGAEIESGGTALHLKSTGQIGRALDVEATHASGISQALTASSESPNASTAQFENRGGGIALQAQGEGGGRQKAALRVKNTNEINGMAAYLTNDSGFATAHFGNDGAGEVLYLTNGGTGTSGAGGGDFIRALNTEKVMSSSVSRRLAKSSRI